MRDADTDDVTPIRSATSLARRRAEGRRRWAWMSVVAAVSLAGLVTLVVVILRRPFQGEEVKPVADRQVQPKQPVNREPPPAVKIPAGQKPEERDILKDKPLPALPRIFAKRPAPKMNPLVPAGVPASIYDGWTHQDLVVFFKKCDLDVTSQAEGKLVQALSKGLVARMWESDDNSWYGYIEVTLYDSATLARQNAGATTNGWSWRRFAFVAKTIHPDRVEYIQSVSKHMRDALALLP